MLATEPGFGTGLAEKKMQRYLGTEIGALNAKLDTCGTLEFSVLAAALCLTLPSCLGARHAFVCRRGGVERKQPASRGALRMRGARHVTQLGPISRNFLQHFFFFSKDGDRRTGEYTLPLRRARAYWNDRGAFSL